ncbi:MAG TPA: TIGR03618 family F420-dependent PPOX class oxidoreductase [Beutenbergiaceae bacterium]|nr:TIGR03618 family F420-dependent PPOX class oxidoreductase [Beutenbergiaceae bacterium]
MSAGPSDRLLNPLAKARGLFEQPNLAHFATVMADGRPTSVPLWVGVEGEQLAVLTIPDSIKDRNICRDPRVAMSLTPADNPYQMASVRGRVAERVTGEAAWPIIDRIAHQYTGGPYPERTNRVVFLIDVEVAWSHTF